jgi:hypothetical protein
VVVIGVGFLPLLAAPLVPYKTVGIFIAAILLTAGLASLLILPSLIALLERYLFPRTKACCFLCSVATVVVSALALVAAVVLNVNQFANVSWPSLAWFALGAVAVLVTAAFLIGRSKRCRMKVPITDEGEEQ